MNKMWGDFRIGEELICIKTVSNDEDDEMEIQKGEICQISKIANDSVPIRLLSLATGKDRGWYSIEEINQNFECHKKGVLKMETLKQYFNKHNETFITLGIVVLLDEFVFGGAFRTKIKLLIDKILKNTEKKLTGETK